jgi:WD40 repeat protein/tRNA A-37 threonylcarbamoyl transferase component Bud32
MEPNSERIREIFTRVLQQKSPAEQERYLTEACQAQPELRQQVESLLHAHEHAGDFLAWNPQVPLSSLGGERAGSMIGRYKLLEPIGEGGFGTVWMAEQEEPVRRRVALKVIKPGMDTKQVLARFESERQALALMDHPGIARVFDGGATDTGRPYFVMELVRGERITDYCDANQLSTRERLELFIQVCQAVQHAHQKGIIHRDLKPSNILVTEVDGAPVPKVIDFGVAKATQARLTELTLFTGLHQMIGTPAYMSPEQAGLGALDMDTRSDIYALGVLLYELLTGQTPITKEDFEKAGWAEIIRLIREQDPPKPSTRLSNLTRQQVTTIAARRQAEPFKLNRLLTGDLDWIVMKALEKDRRRRYDTANSLALDIQRHLQNEPVTAFPPGNWYRFQKMVRRNKLAFAAGGALAVSLILGLGISSVLFVGEKHARANEARMRQQADEAKKQAQAEAARAEAASLEAKKSELKSKEKETEAMTTLSSSEFRQGSRLISDGQFSDALAYLARSLSDNPANPATLTRLATLLESRCWMVPTILLQHQSPVFSAQFSPDGKRILTATGAGANRPYGSAQVWDAQSGQPLIALVERDSYVNLAQFSPDGLRILTASTSGRARVWEAQTGRPQTEPLQLGPQVNSARFSPDGKRILTASNDGTARVWDAQSGQALSEPLKHSNSVLAAQFSPDGKRILTVSADGTARLWDAQSGQPLTGALPYGGTVTDAQFSPDGKRILTVSGDGTNGSARVWDAQSGQPLTEPLKHADRVYSAHFSPDGKRIVTVSADKTARLWDAWSGRPLTEPLKHGDRVFSAQFSPDGKRILGTSVEWTAEVWEAQNSEPPMTENFHHKIRVNSAQFSPDGKRVVTASLDNTARVWDAETGQPLLEPLRHGGEVNSAQFSPDGKRIVTASLDGTARVWDAQSGQPLNRPLPHSGSVNSAQFSPDGKEIVTASTDGTARQWDGLSGQPLGEPLRHVREVRSAQFSPDGKEIVTASTDGTARVWDAQSGRPLTGPFHEGSLVVSARFSPDGQRVVTASLDETARVWDARNGQPLTNPLPHGEQVNSAQFSPEGKRMLTASSDKTAQVWDTQSGQPLTEPLKHDGPVWSAEFSPDGKRIATASGDGTARVWDAQSGQPLADPLQHGAAVTSAQFSPDGKRIVTASNDGTVRVWDIAPSSGPPPAWLLELAEAISGEVLNRLGVLEPTRLNRANTINQIRRELNQEPEADDWMVWGRWFLADPAARTISPFSTIRVSDHVENPSK